MPDGSPLTQTPPSDEDRAKIDAAIVAHMQGDELQVPPLPHVALKLQALVASDKYSSQDLANIVRADQMLSATVLRYANRSAAMRSEPIVALDEAITRLGARELVDVAFGAALGAEASKNGLLLPVRRLVWQQAVVSAILSRGLANQFKVAPEVGFLAGLLHDFGKTLALGALEKVVDTGSVAPASVAFWVDVIESYHIELGSIAATKWNLPAPLPDVIACHHTPDTAGDARAIVDLVNFSDMVSTKMAGTAHLSADDVEALAGVTSGRVTTKALSRAIQDLPGAVSALTSMGGAAKKNAPTLVAKEPISDVAECDQIRATFKKGKDEHQFVVLSIDHDGFTAVGDVAMSEGFVSKATLVDDDISVEMFVNIATCIQSDRVRINGVPFCLNGDAAETYTKIVRRHKEKAAA